METIELCVKLKPLTVIKKRECKCCSSVVKTEVHATVYDIVNSGIINKDNIAKYVFKNIDCDSFVILVRIASYEHKLISLNNFNGNINDKQNYEIEPNRYYDNAISQSDINLKNVFTNDNGEFKGKEWFVYEII